jgi:ATP-binding cassette subfamily B protein
LSRARRRVFTPAAPALSIFLARCVKVPEIADTLFSPFNAMKPQSSPVQATSPNQRRTLALLARHLWPKNRFDLRIRVVIALVSLFLGKLVNVYAPQAYKASIDALTPNSTATLLAVPFFLIFAYGLARIVAQLLGEIRDFVFVRVAQHSQRAIGLQTFSHLHRLSLRFHLDRQTGGLSRIIERGTRGIQFMLSFMLFNIVPTILEIILVTGILFVTFDWRYAAITFFTIALYIAFTLALTEWRLKYRKSMNERDTEANTKAIDSLLNYETVKYFCNEDHEYRRFDSALEQYEKAAVDSQSSLSMLNIGQGLIIGLGLLAVMLLAGDEVVQGKHSVGDFVLVNTYLIQLYLPLNFLGFVYREIKQSLVDMDKMVELINQHVEIEDAPGAVDLEINGGTIVFRGVSFGYSAERQILENVSFEIPKGRTVAVVGPSGSGKSTLSRLLYRFYDVDSGSIEIDGQDLRKCRQASVRAQIGIVPQDTVLFNDTVEYNIRYGKIDATEEEVRDAAKRAQCHDFIGRLERGYQTLVGERGLKLSGGEKQRVAIARTILKNPQILIFDEATSALDSRTEKDIQASLNQVSKNRTTLVIAHRLSTIVDADQILVLKDRQIVERGSHEELLAQHGEYAEMWARQQEEEAEQVTQES